ncbi:bifunctional demethylmenaquinone methyltransferase/2-methoxy-6-polyprenyl-1,4-benzoquinol methylase UbiE [Thalassobaculum litoreum]|uniref:Ubiquinone/menaquinone biosynthesis C-methyltransferase UbiE n=1 Tax=Thalassobaculum litoreum DSM 18839 TaxID=1123362 RepID=A0A8G2BLR2_9PROT|nr:bifunctional demethylmenaquinone methyltransferase/2-methoxy-6-polyprenyl-1,4-benzoquinol methylase UbiE [Thalassobaculum litoreum]SDG09805.1 demethylmenaquinone methyltransferase / 2-methoxy-6-polyprenyl-1,4-benzoquinol methylase [Thalassobaculum litoreum DSM 18839]
MAAEGKNANSAQATAAATAGDPSATDPKIRDGVTDFGFTSVSVEEKSTRVREVFDSVASSYDLMNDLMSLGIHRVWKQAFADWLAPRPGHRLLDVAGGTGDIAALWRKRGGGPVTVCDINAEMIAVGRDRLEKAGGDDAVDWVVGNAEDLPLADASVDRVTIAFGLRNVTRIDRALGEMTRVLRPGGRFMCLEFSRPTQAWLDPIYDTYSFKVLPWLGDKVAQDRPAYQYLAESIRRFPDQQDLAERMRRVGLEQVKWRNLSAGIAAIHSGWRL